VDETLIWIACAGFLAQLIDGALGMAYGVSCTSLLLGLGLPPATASASVHAAECFTTGASALSHWRLGNIDRGLFLRLVLPGVLGAALGALLLSALPGEAMKPWVAAYLLVMGVLILRKALAPPVPAGPLRRVAPLGFIGALVDSLGGGGWGPVVSSTLLARGGEFRKVVGSVNASEFFVTAASSAVFLVTLGLGHGDVILALAVGGVLAAPLGAWAAKHIRPRPLMLVVGLVVIALSLRTLLASLA